MLKLEKIAKTRELNVLLRAKTTLFTPSFLFALTYALLIHLGALFFFQIAPFKISYQQTIFPPVNVASEIPIHYRVYATHEHVEETPIPQFLMAPFPDKPSFTVSHKIPSDMTHIKLQNPLEHFFLSLEERLEAGLVKLKTIPSISLQLSGGIHALELKSSEFYKKNLALFPEADSLPIKFHFNVQVEQENGEIFWWELTTTKGSKKIQEYAINIIRNLRFIPDPSKVILPGEIDLMITLNGMEND